MPVLADLPHVLRPAAAEAAGAIVLLHGPGASEQDMAQLVDVLDPQRRLLAACPRATQVARDGAGWQWFIDREPGYPHYDSFEGSFTVLDMWLQLLAAETGVPPARTLLGGFSQGAVMAWALAMARGRARAAGVLALSGFIPRVADFEFENDALGGLPVAICHGEQDDRVPVQLARSARDRAGEAGAEVFYRESDVGHVLDLRVVPDLVGWVGQRFQPSSEASPQA